VHFYQNVDTVIFLDLDMWDIMRFSTISAANLWDKADFNEEPFVYDLLEILKDKTFVVFNVLEHADMIAQEYAVVFKNGVYHDRGENVYLKLHNIGISAEFTNDHSYWDYQNAKETYLKNI
jgi:predicted glycosyltransferase